MACFQIPHQQLHVFWRTSYCCGRSLSVNQKLGFRLTSIGYPRRSYSRVLCKKESCKVQPSLSSGFCKALQSIHLRSVSTAAQNATLSQSTLLDTTPCEDGSSVINPSNGRVMLIDGTSIIYRAYYKIIGMYKDQFIPLNLSNYGPL